MASKKRTEEASLTTQILIEIRDAIHGTNERVDRNTERLDARLDETNARLDETNARLEKIERRQTETEVRLATELVAVAGAVTEVRDYLKETLAIRPRVDDHEVRLRALESKVG